ncbi:MAG: ABC transporter ATP-binding protein [Pseudomonadota bacterium]
MTGLWRDLATVLGDQLQRIPWVVGVMLTAAALDLLGVSLIAPFVGSAFSATERPVGGTPIWLGIAILLAFALRAVAGFYLQRTIVRFSDHHRALLMSRLLKQYLLQPWAFHLQRSEAELTNTLLYEVALYSGNVLNALLRLIADGLVLLALGLFLVFLSPPVAVAMGMLIGVTVLLVNLVTRRPMRRNAERIVRRYERVVQTVGNSLAALKQARVLGSQRLFCRRLEQAAAEQAEATALQNALQTVPRSALELAVVTLMLGAALWAGQSPGSLAVAMATLGTFGVASIRLIPAATSVANQVNLLRANRPVLGRLANDLRLPAADLTSPTPAAGRLPELTLERVSFSYPGSEVAALRDVSLSIEPGSCCGIVGPSGSGKSTLGDLLLGLLSPTAGVMTVDGTPLTEDNLSWTRRCAYIPQDPCLFHDSLRTNITLDDRSGRAVDAAVEEALVKAALGDLLKELPRGLDESLGDRGQRLSGGQRQRLAIARALFHQREFLVFDEATSALDDATERDIISAITELRGKATVLVITHRKALLAPCSEVFEIKDGQLAVQADRKVVA